jgi:hypothetical protein
MTKRPNIPLSVQSVCPNFSDWPQRWKSVPDDEAYGEGLLTVFRPFIEHLLALGYSRRTVVTHCGNLWLLGGEIVRRACIYEEYSALPRQAIIEAIDNEGGMPCRHLSTPSEIAAYDRTCRTLYKYLRSNQNANT